MQKIIYLFAIICFSFQLNAQKINEKKVPEKVRENFARLYPTIQWVTWKKEEGKFYEANFEMYKMENSATFSEDGVLLETENGIPVKYLMKEIADYIATNYPSEKIKEASKITDAKKKITYEVELKNIEVFFDAAGKFLREEKIKKE
jgi:hypothetical protein